MAEVPIVVCTHGKTLLGQKFKVPEGGLSIGRADDNPIQIQDEGVSRYHVRLLYNSENGKLWLEDAGSRNGVFVNESRVSGHKELKVGDEVTVAEHSFAIRWESDVSDQGTAVPVDTEGSKAAEDDTSDGAGAKRRWFWPFS